MTTMNHVSQLHVSHLHVSQIWEQERRQYRLIYRVAFLVILGITPLARLLPARWRPWPRVVEGPASLVAEARAVTQRILPFAFL